MPVLVLLAGCAGAPVTPEPASDRTAAEEALQSGDYHAAARLFEGLAEQARSPQREEYRLKAAQALIQAGLAGPATRLLQSVDSSRLPADLAMQHQLLQATVVVSEDPDLALSLLARPAAPENETALHARFHQLRARAFSELGNHLDAARESIQRELFLTDIKDIEANQLVIWEALSNLSNQALEQLRVRPPPSVLSGWMELARIAKDTEQPAVRIAERIDEWRQRYPGHPVLEPMLKAIEIKSKALALQPGHIAVLLPLDGRFAQAAEAIRDGILAAYYDSAQRHNVTLRFYDEGSPDEVLARYDTAVNQGAEFVIGPLGKEAVRILAREEQLPVPTIALNHAEPSASESLFQFSLAPETEARQIAELAWLEGHNNAAVLAPAGAWGDRVRESFLQRWEELGGTIASTSEYDAEQSDFSDPIKRMLSIDASERRSMAVRDVIGRQVEFEAYRRQDVDFVFLAAFPRQARLIRPQLRYHRAIGLPIYATSHVYAGHVDPAQDRDMEGIIFGDTPWTLNAETSHAPLRQKVRTVLKRHTGSLQRLVALGLDAYLLVPRLSLLDSYPNDRFQGETGNLHVAPDNRIQRQLVWARFKHGEPQVLPRTLFAEPIEADDARE
ncbi:penicillin-binding protein activator [Thiohalomonas denitrificans]|uniref:penicillin-binding protein activator n=1 Tax=Thiohalomonas denitrificans TaxID=415747 RepID=UPI00158643C3|nr:penicillin-binding protein activator [Thiohalomonas denitrificans]